MWRGCASSSHMRYRTCGVVAAVWRAAARRDDTAAPIGLDDRAPPGLGPADERVAARAPHVGRDRRVYRPRRQHCLAPHTQWRSAAIRHDHARRRPGVMPWPRRDPLGGQPPCLCTAAIHVYGGDFFATERSEWDAQGRDEHRFDVVHAMEQFDAGSVELARGAYQRSRGRRATSAVLCRFNR